MITVQSRSCQCLSGTLVLCPGQRPRRGSAVPSCIPPPASPGLCCLCSLGPGSTVESEAEAPVAPSFMRADLRELQLVSFTGSHTWHVGHMSGPWRECLSQSSAADTWVPVCFSAPAEAEDSIGWSSGWPAWAVAVIVEGSPEPPLLGLRPLEPHKNLREQI